MADTVLVKLGFEFDSSGIKRARQAVERALSGLKIDIDPSVRKAAGGSPGGVVGQAGAFQGEIARLNKQAAATQQKLISAQEKRAQTEERITQLRVQSAASTVGLNKAEQQELGKLIRSLRSQKGSVTKLESKFNESVAASEILQTALTGAASAFVALASGGNEATNKIRAAGNAIKDIRSAGVAFPKEMDAVTRLLTEQRAFISEQIRTSEESFRANATLAEETRITARKIINEGLAAGTLTDAQESVAEELFRQADSIENATRPIRAVAERAAELSIRFGEGGRILAEVLGVTRKEIAQAANKFEGNLTQIVSQFTPGGTEQEQEERARIISLANAAVKAEIQSEDEVVRANKAFVAGQLSRAKTGDSQANEAEKFIVDAFKEVARDGLAAGKNFQTVLNESAEFIGSQLESVGNAVRGVFLQGAKESAQELVRQFSTRSTRLVDTTAIQQELDDQANILQDAFGVTAEEARKLLAPAKLKLEQIQFSELETAAVEEAKEFAREFASAGIKFTDRISSIEAQFQDFPKAISAFRSEFGKAKDILVKEVIDGAKAAGQLDIRKFTDDLKNGFGVAANEAKLIASKVEKQVETARINRAARDFANNILASGQSFDSAVVDFERQFGRLTTGSLREIRTAFNSGAKEFLKAMLAKAKDVTQQIDVSQIETELQRRFGLGGGDAAVAIERFDRDLQEVRRKATEKAADDARKQAAINQEIQAIGQQQIEANKRLLESINDAIKNKDETGKQIFTAEAGGGGAGGNISPVQTLADINRLAKQLDSKSLARFVTLLREEDVNLKKVSAQLKSHQGNIAKSNSLVDQLTIDMNAGQKAAFQFGFAASSAAERLAAWASPAAFIFTAVQLLRDAVTEIVRLDQAAASLAFFQPRILDDIAAGVDRVSDSTRGLGESARDTTGAFNALNTILEKQNAISAASERIQTALIARVKETGIQLQTLTEISRTAGRVGQDAFQQSSDGGGLVASAFQRGIETLSRFEGENFNAEKAVANLNAAINIFDENVERTPVLVARLAEAANNAGLSAGELLETLVRAGPAFRELGVASFTESLTLAAASTQKVIPSAAQLGTLLKQLNVNADGARDAIEKFSGVDIAGEDNLITLPELLEGLSKIETLSGSAKVAFAEAFSDKRVRAGLLGIAQVAGDVVKQLEGIQNPTERAKTAGEALSRVYAATNVETGTFNRELEKLKGSLQDVVKSSGALSIPTLFVRGVSAVVELSQNIGSASKGLLTLKTIFTGLAVAAVPVLQKIVAGFKAGFLQNQIGLTAIQGINESLGKELGLAQAVTDAQTQGLISLQSQKKARELITQELVQVPGLQREIAAIERQINVLMRDEVKNAQQIASLRGQQAQKEAQIIPILEKERQLQREIKTEVNERAASTTRLAGRLGRTAGFIAAGAVSQAIVTGVTNSIEDKGTSKLFGSALQGAFAGIGTGFILGGGLPGAVVGGIVGAGAGLATAYSEANAEAEKIAKQTAEITRQQELARNITEEEFAFRSEAAAKISAAQADVVRIQKEVLDIENEIRRVGADRAKELGIISQRDEKIVELRKSQLAAGKEQEENQKSQEELQRRLVAISQERVQIEKSIGVIQQAQINLLRGQNNLVLEAELNFKFDTAKLAATRRELEDKLSETVLEAGASGVTDKRRIELAKQEGEIRKQLVNLEFDALSRRLEAQREILDASEDSANKQIDAWQSAANSVTSAFADVIGAQAQIAGLVRQESEVIGQIFDSQLQQAQNVLRLGTTDVLSDEILNSLPLAAAAAVKAAIAQFPGQPGAQEQDRNAFLQREFARAQTSRVEASIRDSRSVQTADVPGALDIVDEANALASAIASANLGILRFTDELDPAQRRLVASLELSKDSIDANIQARESLIQTDLQGIEDLVNAKNNEIKAIENSIKALDERAKKDVATADKLVNAPEEFLRQLATQFTAQNFFEGVNFGGDQAQVLEQISARINQVRGNRALTSEILAGIKAAIESGQAVVKGVNNQDLLTVVSRLLLGRSTEDIGRLLDEQKDSVNEITKLNNEIIGLRTQQTELINAQIALASAQETIADQQRKIDQEAQNLLATKADEQIGKFEQLRSEFIESQGKVLSLQEELNRILGERFTEVAGNIFNVDESVKKVRDVLEDIAGADEGVAGFRELRAELEALTKGFGVGAIDSSRLDELLTSTIQKKTNETSARLGKKPGEFGAPSEDFLETGVAALIANLVRTEANRGGPLGEGVGAALDAFNESSINDLSRIFNISSDKLTTILGKLDLDNLAKQLAEAGVDINSEDRFESISGASKIFADDARRVLSELFSGDIIAQRLEELRDAIPKSSREDVDKIGLENEERTRLQEESNRTAKEAAADSSRTRAIMQELLAVTERLSETGYDFSSSGAAASLERITTALENSRREALESGRNPQLPALKISDESLGVFKDAITTAFAQSTLDFQQKINEALKNPLNINFGELAIQFNAEILQKLQDDGFANQITQALIGTGLEDRVGLIQEVLANLVQTELERGNPNVPVGALDGLNPPPSPPR